jgi:hypothetical protein
MADDYTGLKTAIANFLAAVPADKGIVEGREAYAELLRQLTALFRAKCADQGITV